MDSLIIFGAQYLYLVIVAWAIWYIVRQPKGSRWRIILCAILALPLTYVTAKILSTFYYDPRPFVIGNFVPLLPHAPDNGFPSDHTLLSSAIAATIFFFHRKLGLVLFLIAFFVGASRVLAGVHHLVDIVGSMVIASLVTYIVFEYVFPKVGRYVSLHYPN
ncbi:MAG: phosphatase PAP2 family protein, partial [Candidatus Moranbacteria bacterium]|nr:phosphatase PAP2 family protein [Candidatus Moranbacteria bacterium]